jgi:NADPH-dependent glutamate synthase beta subunit-like oxidoreductase
MVDEPVQAAPVWPEDQGWRIRAGVGLLAHTPMSPERRALFDKETEKERQAAELEQQQARERAVERRWELERQGITAHSIGEVLTNAAVALDRQDRRDAAAENRAAEELGKPRPTVNKLLADAKAEREARNAVWESTPVSIAELGRTVQKLKDVVGNTFGKRVP